MDIQLFIVSEYPKGFGDAPLAFFEDELKKHNPRIHTDSMLFIYSL